MFISTQKHQHSLGVLSLVASESPVVDWRSYVAVGKLELETPPKKGRKCDSLLV